MASNPEGLRIARERIAKEAEERTGFLDLGMLGLEGLPNELFGLRHLRRLYLGNYFQDDNAQWHKAGADIGRNGSGANWERISELSELKTLNLRWTGVSDLSPVAGLSQLQSLDCSGTQVSDLLPVAGLSQLQSLDCSVTQVSDLLPVAGLSQLQSLDCSVTQVSDLSPVAGLSQLQSLACSETLVSDLSPVAGLSQLQSLDCSVTQVSDLSPLVGLAALRSLRCYRVVLNEFPPRLLASRRLIDLTLNGATIPGVPAEVLVEWNCLGSLRAHMRDLEAGTVTATDAKLMVLGNGRVGKTQLCRRLRYEGYDEGIASTHGVIVDSAPLPADTAGARLHLWDFGGQDIYHGTHALFMRTRAIFLLVWTPESERAGEHEYGGMVFRNHPLAYWVEYVRHLAGTDCPLLIVQTRCDKAADEARRLPLPDGAIDDFGYCKVLQYSSLKDRGRAALDEALAEAAAWLHERHGTATIGIGRARVKQRLEALRDADAALPPAERQHRSLGQEHFIALCNEGNGDVSSPSQLLGYLHNAGTVFYREGMFGERIILDQGWALEAIYAVFNREKCYRQLRQLHGRFNRSLLGLLVWQAYQDEEQKLFLSMMESCGICFVHRRGNEEDDSETEYLAPDLLPGKDEIAAELEEKWDAAAPCETAEFEYEIHQPGLLRGLVCQIGASAGVNGLYWQGGACVYERNSRSRLLIEQVADGEWSGKLRLSTQNGQARGLLEQMVDRLEREHGLWGVRATARKLPWPVPSEVPEADAPALAFVQEKPAAPEYCVSYAWGDTSPEGKTRATVVDGLCAAAEARGIRLLRDKTALGLGERISRFMQRIGAADRVFVVLSEKYLRSPYCMFELLEVWRNARRNEDDFLQRVRVYTLPCAAIGTVAQRLRYAGYWDEQHEEIKTFIRNKGAHLVGESSFRQFRLMSEFAAHVDEILSLMADVVQPRTFAELEQYGFDDLAP